MHLRMFFFIIFFSDVFTTVHTVCLQVTGVLMSVLRVGPNVFSASVQFIQVLFIVILYLHWGFSPIEPCPLRSASVPILLLLYDSILP